jgi:hypothetical protein
MMIKHVLVILTLLTSFKPTGEEPVERLGVKGPLTFNGTSFQLAWTSNPADNYFIQEYLPAGENVEHFHHMMSLFLETGHTTLKKVVSEKVAELDQRKKTDPTCHYLLIQNPDSSEYILDFVLGESKNDKMTTEEFTIYRFKEVDLGNNKKGVLIFAFSKRAYGNDITPFYQNLKTDREKLINAMIDTELPAIHIAGKSGS